MKNNLIDPEILLTTCVRKTCQAATGIKIFFHLVDIALFNALFCKEMDMTKGKKCSFSKSRLDVTEQILQSVCIPD